MAGHDDSRLDSWTLVLLGRPALRGRSRTVQLERRTAVVLAYLALEGPTVRRRLAGQLWPEKSERTARSNLRQLLRRLRVAADEDVVRGGETLELASNVLVDRSHLERLALEERHVELLAYTGDLLEGQDHDDMPDIAEWLLGERERLLQLRVLSAEQESRRREAQGDLEGAVEYARHRVTLDPLAEPAYRRLMRLHALSGDRATALGTYERFRAFVREALGTEPSPETRALADEIARNVALPVTLSAVQPIPLAVLRPPVLVGREQLWSALQQAWATGCHVALYGEPGQGKSRLAFDFASARGSAVRVEARSGDAGLAYSTAARLIRMLIERHGPLNSPKWVLHELTRLLPELGTSAGRLGSDEERLRFHDALLYVVRTQPADTVIVIDDVHLADAATLELIVALLHVSETRSPRLLLTFRPAELDERTSRTLDDLIGRRTVVSLHVGPLDEQGVARLLDSLGLPNVSSRLASRFARYTGGTPLFVVETLKHLHQSGRLEHGVPDDLPPPEPIGAVIRQRLRRLTPRALHVARAASVLSSDYHVEWIADLLESTVLDVLTAWDELTAAQVVHEVSFVHDVLRETILADVPPATRQLLHRAAARVLRQHSQPALIIARHWQAGGEPRNAVPLLVEAASDALRWLRFDEAIRCSLEAADIADAAGDAAEAFALRAQLLDRLWLYGLNLFGQVDLGPRASELKALPALLAKSATTPEERAWVYAANAIVRRIVHLDAESAEREARAGLDVLPVGAAPDVRAVLLRLVIESFSVRGTAARLPEYLELAEQSLRVTSDGWARALLDLTVGLARQFLLDDPRAAEHLTRATAFFETTPSQYGLYYARTALAEAYVKSGETQRAIELRRQLEVQYQTADRSNTAHFVNSLRLATLLLARHQYIEAHERLGDARGAGSPNALHEAYRLALLADLHLALGQYAVSVDAARAVTTFERNAHSEKLHHLAWIHLGMDDLRHGRTAQAAAAFDRAAMDSPNRSYVPNVDVAVRVALARVALLPPQHALDALDDLLPQVRSSCHDDLLCALLTARAEVLLTLGRLDEASRSAREAMSLSDEHPSPYDPLLTYVVTARVQDALRDPGRFDTLNQARARLEALLEHDVPEDARGTFLATPTVLALRALLNQTEPMSNETTQLQ